MMKKRCKNLYVKNPDTKKCSKDKMIIKLVECRKNKVKLVMNEFKLRNLYSRYSKEPVKNSKQALAITLSEAKKYCK